MSSDEAATAEISAGERFAFGSNWQEFLELVDDDRVNEARRSLTDWLGVASLDGRRFLDVGCGSGLFSLAARQLGAEVVSFDFDASSVAAARELQRRFRGEGAAWQIMTGSVLDTDFLATLGRFDVVYAWGVLHHTGALFEGLENVLGLVGSDGCLFVSVYNDQGWRSDVWSAIKRRYNRSSPVGQRALVTGIGAMFGIRSAAAGALGLRRRQPVERGMSTPHDLVDWVGGYPFEVAKPEAVFDAVRSRGFRLERLRTCGGGLGCNEFLFKRLSGAQPAA